ncbi:MAG TPA: hypothetical protein VJO33_00035 [Gemmatimonadaceae bacterium]|nr:hypothetical protein [Gemmatimonadaceae bacterium]
MPSGEHARVLFLPSLSEMFSTADEERLARRIHPPMVVFQMLGVTAMVAALFAGYGMANAPARNLVFIVGIAGTVSIVTYVILELEYPRVGLIRVDPFDQVLVELRGTMR